MNTKKSEITDVTRKRILADYYFDNYKKYRRIKKYPKASEFLWGALNNLVYALGLILYGERPSTHSKIKDIINKISVDFNKPEIADLFKASAEVLHANFYHDFLDEDSFNYHAENVERLLLKLAQILEKSTSKS